MNVLILDTLVYTPGNIPHLYPQETMPTKLLLTTKGPTKFIIKLK